jgi:hypothetical protein
MLRIGGKKKAHSSEGFATKMKPPDMPKKGWKLADVDEEVEANVEHNFVWPMETVERIYFYVKGTNILSPYYLMFLIYLYFYL